MGGRDDEGSELAEDESEPTESDEGVDGADGSLILDTEQAQRGQEGVRVQRGRDYVRWRIPRPRQSTKVDGESRWFLFFTIVGHGENECPKASIVNRAKEERRDMLSWSYLYFEDEIPAT